MPELPKPLTEAEARAAARRLLLSRIRWGFTIIILLIFLGRLFSDTVFARIDEIALGLMALAALPWLAEFVEEFSFGGLKAKMRDQASIIEEARRDAEAAKATAEITQQEVELAEPAGRPVARLEADVAGTGGAMTDEGATAPSAYLEQLVHLAKSYVATRRRMRSGNDRTSEMTRIFREMMAVSSAIGAENTEPLDWLASDDQGKKLAGIAYAYELPGTTSITQMVNAIMPSEKPHGGTRDKPFVEYWALMVLRKLTRQNGAAAWSPEDVQRFLSLRAGFPPHTDRGRIYEQIATSISPREALDG